MSSPLKSLLLLSVILLAAGCKPDPAVRQGAVIDQGINPPSTSAVGPAGAAALNTASVDANKLGAVKGTITFAGTPPPRVAIDMSMDPACAMSPGPGNRTEQFVVNSGKLANVFVYIKQGATPTQAAAGARPVVLDQRSCQYTPHVIAVQQGGYVEFRNSDPTMHNIHTMPDTVGNDALDVSQGPNGHPQIRQFKSPQVMMPIRCNNHPWMNAFLNVADTPYFAVSAADGTFSIPGLPQGAYTLAAVHEKLGEQDFQITVPAKGTATVNIAFRPH